MIGGLLLATLGTLFVVPIMYSLFRKKAPVDYDKEVDREYNEQPGGQPAGQEG